ncbi:MAG: hypothetical protein JSV99_07200 [Planctomycetota bacterium]|nr:MAG: hypothetical protein JSV99_07200 [Planctomycetota bacterium]
MAKKRNARKWVVTVVLLFCLTDTARARIVVDDFDSYADNAALWAVWDDYWVNDSDAEIFLETDPCGLNLTRDGNSVKFRYTNVTKSPVQYVGSWMDAQDMSELEVGSDWTAGGVETLNVYFRGDPCSEVSVGVDKNAARMWVELEDTSSNIGTVYHDDVNDMFEASWHKWSIDLNIYDACGVTLSAIDRFAIGIGGAKAGQTKAMVDSGRIWLDDICLTAPTDYTYVYVDADATGVNDGTNWADAYKYLQDALADADSNPNIDEIWVAEGTYYPDVNVANPGGSNRRDATFQLINGVTVKGGYGGPVGGPKMRNVDCYPSILSGDINVPDSNSDNSYHVVTGSGTEPNAVLDGFIITAGNANGSGTDANGGGMYNDTGSPTVTNCYWWRCSASSDGGAVWSGWSAPFSMTYSSGSENSASRGGALANFAGTSRLTNCIFNGNDANNGGAIVTLGGTVNITNCTLSGNSAQSTGGGICDLDGGTVTIKNNIMWNDTSPDGNEIAVANGSTVDVNYSIIQDGNAGIYNDGLSFVGWGAGNQDVDPCFVDSTGPDYDFHLRSEAGYRRNEDSTWYYDGETSPAIDMGDPDYPLGQETFPNGGRINAGAYGGTNEASRTPSPAGVCETWIAGDINGDCIINFHDLAFIGDHWLVDNAY